MTFFVYEIRWIYIDIYNFKQLNNFKAIVIENKKDTDYKNLKKFNYLYNGSIEPIKNCYYVSSFNGKNDVIFGFKLESLIFQLFNFSETHVYPSYDISPHYICQGNGNCNYDGNKGDFLYTISNPCE